MSLDLGDHASEIPITNLLEEEHRLLEDSLSICKKDPNQWSTEERMAALAGALIHRYLVNDGTIHPALRYFHVNRVAIQSFLDQIIETDQIHRSLQTFLAFQMLLSLADCNHVSPSLTNYLSYLTGIVDHNINELNDWIASISRETDVL